MTELEQIDIERPLVAVAMTKMGGSFVQALGEALTRADPYNALLIKQTWPRYWDKYLELAREADEGQV